MFAKIKIGRNLANLAVNKNKNLIACVILGTLDFSPMNRDKRVSLNLGLS